MKQEVEWHYTPLVYMTGPDVGYGCRAETGGFMLIQPSSLVCVLVGGTESVTKITTGRALASLLKADKGMGGGRGRAGKIEDSRKTQRERSEKERKDNNKVGL